MIRKLTKKIQQMIYLNFIFTSFLLFPFTKSENKIINQFPFSIIEKDGFSEDNMVISVNPYNCPVWGYCYEQPVLNFNVEDLSADSSGYKLGIDIGGQLTYYEQTNVMFQLPVTNSDGTKVAYWLVNSQGSIFSNDEFYYRLTSLASDTELYRIEFIGDRWEDSIPTYALTWNVFPPINAADYSWALQYDHPSDLNTWNDYALLAGRLIWNGTVDASSCQYGGLESNGAASQCGIEAAREQVIIWQNAHDSEILSAGQNALIPQKLLKGIIAVESQFWPDWEIRGEYGLGMITEDGVDLLLKWNSSYFFEKCSQVYTNDWCKNGYFALNDKQLTYLIGYILQDIGTANEYQLLAETLNAASIQTSQLIYNYTGLEPYEVADFETLWRITLGIYQAGCGCMGEAIKESWKKSKTTLIWSEISSHLTGTCAGADDYFDKAIQYSQ